MTKQDTDFDERFKARRNHVTGSKALWEDALLLLLPTFEMMLLFLATLYSLFLSLLLLYFLLPMFYTVEERVRARLTGIGKKDFTYADGYTAFFKGNQAGIFGAMSTVLLGLGIFFIEALLLAPLMPNLVNCFPGASEVFSNVAELYTNPVANAQDIQNYLLANGAVLAQPFTVYFGLLYFIPIFALLFFMIDSNIVDHHISTIVLPDIDLNVSASMSRLLSRRSFGRFSSSYRAKKDFQKNWPFYLLFIVFYGIILWACTYIKIDNYVYLVPVVMITPVSACFFGIYLNHFVLINKLAIAEESQDVILDSLPSAMRTSIEQTFESPSYIHGKESQARGSFLHRNEGGTTYYEGEYEVHEDAAPATAPEKPYSSKDGVQGGVIDLSRFTGKDSEDSKR